MYYIEPPGIYLLYLEGIQLVKFLWNPHKTPSRNAESCCFWVVGWWPVLWNGLFALVRVQVVSKERVKGQIPICLPFEVGVSSVWMKGTVWEPGTVFSPCALSRTGVDLGVTLYHQAIYPGYIVRPQDRTSTCRLCGWSEQHDLK